MVATIASDQLVELLPFERLIDHLSTAMLEPVTLPVRSRVPHSKNSEMLIMPVAGERFVGIKTLNILPHNTLRGLPAIDGLFALFDGDTGAPLAVFDVSELTGRRTAAMSALAARALAREEAAHLLILGTGHLAPYMAEAHATARPLSQITIWGRSEDKAQATARQITDRVQCAVEVVAPDGLSAACGRADIVSAATRATQPIIKGDWIQPGTHIDLVGGYRADMREIDDVGIAKAHVFVDNREAAMVEAGDILSPLQRGIIGEAHVQGDLRDLLTGVVRGSGDEITVFKSVGSAASDLAAAVMAYQCLSEHE